MFGLSLSEVVVIAVVALLALGPERLPSVARSLGRMLAELRRAMDEVKYEFNLHDPFRNEQQSSGRGLPPRTGLRTASFIELESVKDENETCEENRRHETHSTSPHSTSEETLEGNENLKDITKVSLPSQTFPEPTTSSAENKGEEK